MVCRIAFSWFVAMVSILLIIPAPYARVYGFSPGRASFSLSAWVSRGAAPGPRWGRRPPRSSQRSLRVAAKAASFNSLAHWASASLLPPLAALGSAPRPAFEKSGGKPAGILLLISNRICRRAAHRERPARFVGWFWCGKGWRMDRMAGQKFQRFGRGGGRAQRAQSRGGGPWPPPLLWFCGPFGPAKRRRPRRTPSAPLRPSEKGAAAAGCGPGGWAGKRYGFTAAWNAARSASASSVGSYR